MAAAEVLLFKNIHENFYYAVFRVAYYESDVRFSKVLLEGKFFWQS